MEMWSTERPAATGRRWRERGTTVCIAYHDISEETVLRGLRMASRKEASRGMMVTSLLAA